MIPIAFEQTLHGIRVQDVEFIWAKNSKEFFFANSICVHGGEPIIIDPSANFTYMQQLADRRFIKFVINTHYHADHRALNGLFRGVTFMAHRLDAPALRSWRELQRRIDTDADSPYSRWVQTMLQNMHIEESNVTRELEDGEIFETSRHRIRIVHLPGHTAGMIGLHFERLGILFIADIDLTPVGPWYANVASDIDAFKTSIEKIRRLELPYYVTSHGERIYTREEFLKKLEKYESHFARRDERILAALRERPRTLDELATLPIIYKSSALADPLRAYFAKKMVEKHLLRLELLGEIAHSGALWRLR